MIQILSLLLGLFYFITTTGDSLDDVRRNYSKMASDKQLCKSTLERLKVTKSNSATHLGYLGGLQTIWANHAFGPLSKLSTFNDGKKNIEQAIRKEPNNAELRFIRLSVQKNAPSFLGYNSNIKEDSQFIKDNQGQVKSEIVNRYIELLLKE